MSSYETITDYEVKLKMGLVTETINVNSIPPYTVGQKFTYERHFDDGNIKREVYVINDISHSAKFRMNYEKTVSYETFTITLTLQ